MSWDSEFEKAFNPRAVAFVGVSRNSVGGTYTFFPAANGFMVRMMERGYEGRVYPINPGQGEVAGLKVYPDLKSLPEAVDLVVVCVPAKAVPSVLEDSIAAGAKNIHIYTAGFEETGLQEGKRLAGEVREIVERGGLRVIGPNCMGLYVPGTKVSMWPEADSKGGHVAFVSQSGRLAQDYAEYAQHRGIGFSKSISFGNGYGIRECDFLEYLTGDPDTRVIGMYLEGLSDGQRFVKTVKGLNRVKPVVVWKSGLTDAGSQAARSHTGSMAGQEKVWNAFYRQTGAIPVASLEEMADAHLALLNLPPPKGRRVAHFGVGGGSSVASADIYARAGFAVPKLSEDTRNELRRFIAPAGTSVRNPLDISGVMRDTDTVKRTLEKVAADPVVDIIVIAQHWLMVWFTQGKVVPTLAEYLTEFVRENRYGKPLVAVTRNWTEQQEGRGWIMELDRALLAAGIPTYPTEERAASALSKYVGYYEFLDRG
jgi:acyl-CoA synthetase (NDP forming)